MAVTIKDVEHIAKLAKLEFTEAEKAKLVHQLNDILRHMETLNKLDTSNVEPLSQVIELGNVFRADEMKPGLPTEEALRNAPAKNDRFFKVPRVVGGK